MKKLIILLCAALTVACAPQTPPNTLMVKYENYTPSNDIDQEIEFFYNVHLKSKIDSLLGKFYTSSFNNTKKKLEAEGKSEKEAAMIIMIMESLMQGTEVDDAIILEEVKPLYKSKYSLEQIKLMNKLYSQEIQNIVKVDQDSSAELNKILKGVVIQQNKNFKEKMSVLKNKKK